MTDGVQGAWKPGPKRDAPEYCLLCGQAIFPFGKDYKGIRGLLGRSEQAWVHASFPNNRFDDVVTGMPTPYTPEPQHLVPFHDPKPGGTPHPMETGRSDLGSHWGP